MHMIYLLHAEQKQMKRTWHAKWMHEEFNGIAKQSRRNTMKLHQERIENAKDTQLNTNKTTKWRNYAGVGKCPNWTSPNYWGYNLQQIFEGDVQNHQKGTFTDPCYARKILFFFPEMIEPQSRQLILTNLWNYDCHRFCCLVRSFVIV